MLAAMPTLRAVLLLTMLGAPAFAGEGPPSITALAASSLAGVLPRLAEAWTSVSGVKVIFSFDATPRLAEQARAGVPADLIVSADESWLDDLRQAKAVLPETRRALAGNRLAAVVPASSALKAGGAAVFASSAVARVALAGEAVPAGRYAQAALAKLGLWEAVAPKVVRAGSVRGALRWLAEGQADAGVVYATDDEAEPRVRALFLFPEKSHPPIVYWGAALSQAKRPGDALAFLEFCRGKKAAALWRRAGFKPPRP